MDRPCFKHHEHDRLSNVFQHSTEHVHRTYGIATSNDFKCQLPIHSHLSQGFRQLRNQHQFRQKQAGIVREETKNGLEVILSSARDWRENMNKLALINKLSSSVGPMQCNI